MDIIVRRMDESMLSLVNECNEPFIVDSQWLLDTESGDIRYRTVPVASYEKRYPSEERDYAAFLTDPDKVIFVVYLGPELAGHIRLLKHWNNYGYVDDIAIKARFRRRGVGRTLTESAIAWARERGYPGLMLETQNNNVAACRLYESCGFQLGGFDRFLYRGLDPGTQEVAMYWYFLFEKN